jgi:hypothetical protein
MDTHEGMPIFVVLGATGEYDDYQEWIVCAYRHIEDAQNHAGKAEEEARRLFKERPESSIHTRHVTPFDANMQIDYTGTKYLIEETTLHGAFLK